jgi:hypothetical protein
MSTLDLFLKLNGFKVDSECVINTKTLWAKFMCDCIVKDGGFIKLRKNRYKLV